METKRIAAERAVEYVGDGMVVGLGTGSTAYWAIQKLGARVKEGLRVKAIATSIESEALARELGIPILSFADLAGEIDLTIDGADEVDADNHLIKGGGGALLREKIVAKASRELIVIVDQSKLVDRLGDFPLPVEIVPFGCEMTLRHVSELGCKPVLRTRGDEPFRTDNGNYIADCAFGAIHDPGLLETRLNGIPGVVENGLFVGMSSKVIVGCGNGDVVER
ncbi:ribose-5-phosphate isomerase RpiA [Paenibacillus arenilitoris]|uniref:Ribose-5-phosphate isomerase A n=1 Tax=Paenibacillus arenilitoris TaxID=2772299 RepID=A0A927CRC1_9BACL|nr:ribose-5-phosphate isomerase RpiA [Paenibacillus arenilitoris]MBD2870816.1 ribose-5-phosphate isomerase RpiA [Paenibacillus arenilitoris]